MKNKTIYWLIGLVLLLIIVLIIGRNKKLDNANNLQSRVMVDDGSGRLMHLDCTKQINCGYCKKVGIPCIIKE